MEPREIQQSTGKAYLFLAGSFLFVGMCAYSLHTTTEHRFILWAGLLLFGFGIPVFAAMIVRPQRLLLDATGFEMLGGVRFRRNKVLWAEVDRFFLYSAGRAGKQIGFNYKPEVNRLGRMRPINRAFGAEGVLPNMWDMKPDAVVQLLNEYRMRAEAEAAELEDVARVTSTESP